MSVTTKTFIPSSDTMQLVQQRQVHFNEECARALKWSYRLQGLTAKNLEQQITGIKTATWGAYGQQSYNKNRTLHVLVLFSWLSQICVKNLFHGNNIEKHYGKGENIAVIECITYACKLPTAQFRELANVLLLKAHANLNTTPRFLELSIQIKEILHKLQAYNADKFLMPKNIDVEEFKYDFYRSVSLVLKEWRALTGVSQERMAIMLGESIERYRDYENPNKTVSIPANAIMRLLIDFKADETALIQFGKYMETYTGQKESHIVQAIRSEAIVLLTSIFDIKTQRQVASFIKSYVRFY